MRGSRKAGQCGAAGVSDGVYVCVWHTCECVCVFMAEAILMLWSHITSTSSIYWLLIPCAVSVWVSVKLSAALENTGGGRRAAVRHIKHTVDHVCLLVCLSSGDIKVCTSVSDRFRFCWVIALSAKTLHSEDSKTSKKLIQHPCIHPLPVHLILFGAAGVEAGGRSLSQLSLEAGGLHPSLDWHKKTNNHSHTIRPTLVNLEWIHTCTALLGFLNQEPFC